MSYFFSFSRFLWGLSIRSMDLPTFSFCLFIFFVSSSFCRLRVSISYLFMRVSRFNLRYLGRTRGTFLFRLPPGLRGVRRCRGERVRCVFSSYQFVHWLTLAIKLYPTAIKILSNSLPSPRKTVTFFKSTSPHRIFKNALAIIILFFLRNQ